MHSVEKCTNVKNICVKKGTLPLRWVSNPGPFE